MSSYLSSFLTTTTSRYASIKQTLLASEADGDTEDDTNVCRTLRSYYTEKGRPFPGWLPPDPKAPAPIAQPVYAQNNVGAGYGGIPVQDASRPGASRLNSLWDSGRGGQGEAQSLRNGARPGARGGLSVPEARRSPFDRSQTASEPPPQARPLPSQRAGSYQTAGRGDAPPLGGGSAQDRLKARFGKGASTPRMGDSARQNSGNSSGSYEDSFAPGNYNMSSRGGESYSAPSPPAKQAPAKMGLPSGPAARRGLPSGPRSMR